jgi:hypothetical protein
VTKDKQRQGMGELLAKQRTGPPITPSEAARQRRSGRRGPVPDSVGTGPPEAGPAAGTQPPEDLARTEETLGEKSHATRDQPETADAAASDAGVKAQTPVEDSRVAGLPRSIRPAEGPVAQMKDHAAAGADIAEQAVPGPARHAVSRAASNKRTLLAAACAIAVAVVCWLAAGRRRQATAQAAEPKVSKTPRQMAGKIGGRAAGAVRSAWPARRT